MRVEATAIGEINVEPAIVVVVEKRDAAAFGFDNDALVFNATPDVGDVQACVLGNIDELYIRTWRGRDGSLELIYGTQLPQRRREPVEQWVAEHEQT